MCGVIVNLLIVVIGFQMLSQVFGTYVTAILIILVLAIEYLVAKKSKEKNEKNIKNEKLVVQDFLKSKNFTVTKSISFHFHFNFAKIHIEDESTYFIVDDIYKQFAILSCSKNEGDEFVKINDWNCYAYAALLDFDVKESGVSVLPGRGCNAAVGAVIGGVTGAVIGSVAGSKKMNEECSNLIINIIMNNVDNPLISIDCLAGKTYKKDSPEYKETIKTVNEIIAVLTYIQVNKDAVPKLTVSDNDVIKQENNEYQNVDIQQRVCSNCGSVLDADSVFCGNCGKKYEKGV